MFVRQYLFPDATLDKAESTQEPARESEDYVSLDQMQRIEHVSDVFESIWRCSPLHSCSIISWSRLRATVWRTVWPCVSVWSTSITEECEPWLTCGRSLFWRCATAGRTTAWSTGERLLYIIAILASTQTDHSLLLLHHKLHSATESQWPDTDNKRTIYK